VLGAVRYQPNEAILHTDASFLPRRREAWAAWNYVSAGACGGHDRPVSVSYLINRLQPLPFRSPVLVTLNGHREPAAGRLIRRLRYRHPVFDRAALAAQRRLTGLQGTRRTWYCGAWTRYGFHEDGLLSATAVARALGCALPWQSDLRAA
jgi:predicted NAD/FAD-binding protein